LIAIVSDTIGRPAIPDASGARIEYVSGQSRWACGFSSTDWWSSKMNGPSSELW
jgi:hypothetical protein